MDTNEKLLFVITSLLTLAVQIDAVTVKQSLCPTNKIAPHRRAASWEQSKPRTLGLIYSLLTPSRPRPPPVDNLDDLQEQPEDDPDDCGEIEDYDETDLSSITPGAHNNGFKNREHRLFFGDYDSPSYPPYYPVPDRPVRPPHRPSNSHRPHRPTYPHTKPPYSSGISGSGNYGPPSPHYPSNYVKPVVENTYENPQAAYRPGLVGGILGYVTGFPVKPTLADNSVTAQKKPSSTIRFPDSERKRRVLRAKEPNLGSSIIGSFVDLLFN
ncbi:uncharacterized protein LOC142976603 [Anticarsia gemmatalis]|uniref:uncharacterized protein LOC142976603 n=1 Tax=Anticarsia gemmatalis TaxID=129554 RepID=UPI003F76646C